MEEYDNSWRRKEIASSIGYPVETINLVGPAGPFQTALMQGNRDETVTFYYGSSAQQFFVWVELEISSRINVLVQYAASQISIGTRIRFTECTVKEFRENFNFLFQKRHFF